MTSKQTDTYIKQMTGEVGDKNITFILLKKFGSKKKNTAYNHR